MEKKREYCQYYHGDLVLDTYPDTRLVLPLRRYWWVLKRYVWHISVLGLLGFFRRMVPSTQLARYVLRGKAQARYLSGNEELNMQAGEMVEVRSLREIFATLDDQGKLRGLRFNPEMAKFCGKQFRVYKKIDKIILEATGELRKFKVPTVLLEGVFCDGSAHGGCDRSCLCFWREAWLKRVK